MKKLAKTTIKKASIDDLPMLNTFLNNMYDEGIFVLPSELTKRADDVKRGDTAQLKSIIERNIRLDIKIEHHANAFLFTIKDKSAGYAIITVSQVDIVEIWQFYLLPEYRDKGYGKVFLKSLIDLINEKTLKKYKDVPLYYMRCNHKSLPMIYSAIKLKFLPLAKAKDYYHLWLFENTKKQDKDAIARSYREHGWKVFESEESFFDDLRPTSQE